MIVYLAGFSNRPADKLEQWMIGKGCSRMLSYHYAIVHVKEWQQWLRAAKKNKDRRNENGQSK